MAGSCDQGGDARGQVRWIEAPEAKEQPVVATHRGPVEEHDAALQAQGHPRRVLVGRRQVGQSSAAGPANTGLHLHPFVVDGDRRDGGAGQLESGARARVAGIFDPAGSSAVFVIPIERPG